MPAAMSLEAGVVSGDMHPHNGILANDGDH